MATGVGRVGSPLGGANPKRTCCDPSGKCLPPRASAVLPGLAGRLGLRLGALEPAFLTFSTETPKVGGVPRRDPGGVGGSGVFSDPGPGADGLGRCRPSGGSTAPGPSPHSSWKSCFPGSFGFRAGGGCWSSRHPFQAGERFSACARVRAVAWPAGALPGSRPAGPPLAIGSLGCLPGRVDLVLHVPPQFTAVVRAQDVFISGLVYTSCLQLPFV